MDSPQKHPLVLVVEPSPTLQKIIKLTFDREGGQTILYQEPEQVLRVIRQNPFPRPDIAFVELTARKSYRLIRILKSRQEWKRLAIVAVSLKDSRFSRLKARCAGAIAYLPKPFTTAQLVACAMNHSQH
jgi:DNA-binding response OmpR family regulator